MKAGVLGKENEHRINTIDRKATMARMIKQTRASDSPGVGGDGP